MNLLNSFLNSFQMVSYISQPLEGVRPALEFPALPSAGFIENILLLLLLGLLCLPLFWKQQGLVREKTRQQIIILAVLLVTLTLIINFYRAIASS